MLLGTESKNETNCFGTLKSGRASLPTRESAPSKLATANVVSSPLIGSKGHHRDVEDVAARLVEIIEAQLPSNLCRA
jgi:hypothetical protein